METFHDAMATPAATPSGPSETQDGTYEKAILKGEIKLEPKLGNDNYQTWSEAMELFLSAQLLWDKVDGSMPCPDVIIRPKDNKAWKFDDLQARVEIFANCEQTQQSHLRNIKTSHEAWEALRKVHGAKHRGRINFLMKKFYTYKVKDDESIDDVAVALKNIQLSIREIKETEAPTDFAVAIALMSAIDSDNESYRMAIFHLEQEANLTLELALECLKSAEQSLKDKEGARLDIATEAKDRSDRKCLHCQKSGHVKAYCYDWLDNTAEGRTYAKEHPNPYPRRSGKSTEIKGKEREDKKKHTSHSSPALPQKQSSTSVSRGRRTDQATRGSSISKTPNHPWSTRGER